MMLKLEMANRILESVVLKMAEEAGRVKVWWWKDARGADYPHRNDGGPAVMWTNGENRWAIFGEEIYSYEVLQKRLSLSSKEIVFLKLKYGKMS